MDGVEWMVARDDDCPVCAGRCAFCDRQLEKREGSRGYCRRCDVTYLSRGCVPGYASRKNAKRSQK